MTKYAVLKEYSERWWKKNLKVLSTLKLNLFEILQTLFNVTFKYDKDKEMFEKN